jgi:DNA-binding beta-propeller fold protein YncE
VSTGSFTVAVTDSSTYQQVAVKAFSLEVTGTLSGLGTFPTGMAVDNPSHQVWVAATGSNQITKIDTTANPPAVGAALTDASGSLNYPANLVYDESGSVLSVANLFGSSVTLFGSTSVKVALSGCAHPAGEALVGTHQVYVACGTSSQLYRVDDSTGTTTASGALASGAILSGMADSGTTASGSDAVLAADAQPSGSLYAVDPSTLAVISSRALPAGATAATVAVFNSGSNSVSNTAYAADPGTSQVSIIDVNKGATGAFNGFGTATTVPSVPAGCVPYGVAVGPSNNTLVVSCSGLNEALVYDISNIAGGTPDVPVLLETVAIGSVPDEVAIANGGTVGLAFISNESDNTVSVIDPPNRKSIPAGPLPILSEPVLSPAGPTAPTTTGAAPAPAASPAHAKTKTKTKATKKRRKAKHTTHRRKHVKHHTKHKAKATRGHPASHALVVAQAHLDPLLAPVNGHTVR